MQNIKCPDCGNLNPDIRELGYTLPATCGHCLHMWRLQDVDPHGGCIAPPTPAAPAQQPEPAITLPEHQRSAPLAIYLHDGDDGHTEPFPSGMDDGVTWSSDNATGLGVPYVRADLIRSSVAGPSFSSCSAGGCPDKRGCDAAQHCLYTAPQAPQQAGHIPTVEDIDAQDWAGMDGATAYQVIERHGEDWSHIGRLMAAWLAANQAPGMTDAIQQAVAAERERCLSIIEAHQVPVGNSAAGEMAAEWTMDALREVRDAIRSDPQVTSTKKERP